MSAHRVIRTINEDGTFSLDLAEMRLDQPQKRATDHVFIPIYSDAHCDEQAMIATMREELLGMLAALNQPIIDASMLNA